MMYEVGGLNNEGRKKSSIFRFDVSITVIMLLRFSYSPSLWYDLYY